MASTAGWPNSSNSSCVCRRDRTRGPFLPSSCRICMQAKISNRRPGCLSTCPKIRNSKCQCRKPTKRDSSSSSRKCNNICIRRHKAGALELVASSIRTPTTRWDGSSRSSTDSKRTGRGEIQRARILPYSEVRLPSSSSYKCRTTTWQIHSNRPSSCSSGIN